MQEINPLDPDSIPAHKTAQELLAATYEDIAIATQNASHGISSLIHQLDNTVNFMLDNHQEVVLRVRKIEIMHADQEVYLLRIHCRADFENVLILAKKLNMRMSAFSNYFSVILAGKDDFIETWNDAILNMQHPSQFFETLDEIKRPIFLNLNHYTVTRISD